MVSPRAVADVLDRGDIHLGQPAAREMARPERANTFVHFTYCICCV